MVAKIVVFSVLVGITCAATWRGKLPLKPQEFAHKEGCYIREINDVIPFGESVSPIGVCYRISCGRHLIDYASCGVIGIAGDDENCYKLEQDLSKPYPDCCATVKCVSHNNIVDNIDNNIDYNDNI